MRHRVSKDAILRWLLTLIPIGVGVALFPFVAYVVGNLDDVASFVGVLGVYVGLVALLGTPATLMWARVSRSRRLRWLATLVPVGVAVAVVPLLKNALGDLHDL